jgi:hypothetical protein
LVENIQLRDCDGEKDGETVTERRRVAMRKAIAYTSDIVLGRTGEVIRRAYQKVAIEKYASENGIEIISWFEDEMYNESVLGRPGIRALLAFNDPYDLVLTERVWALSRYMGVLERFFAELDRRGKTFDCATLLWDCVSQKCRRRFNPSLRGIRREPDEAVRAGTIPVNVKVPEAVRFAHR